MEIKSDNKNSVDLAKDVKPQHLSSGVNKDSEDSFFEELKLMLNADGAQSSMLGQNMDISQYLSSTDITMGYDCVSMDEDDAKFFVNMISSPQVAFNQNSGSLTEILSEDKMIYKSQRVSKALMSNIESAFKTNKPMRIDFDNQISVIMRVDKDGKLSAQFYPSDKVAEEYLRNNISYLKQRFQDMNIPYNELSYKQQKQGNKEEQNQNNNQKENK